MKIIFIFLLFLFTHSKIVSQKPKERKLFFVASNTVQEKRQILRQRFDKILGKIVKDKLQNFQATSNFDENEDATMRDMSQLYEQSLKEINTTNYLVETQMDQLYSTYVRRDPFRSYYDY